MLLNFLTIFASAPSFAFICLPSFFFHLSCELSIDFATSFLISDFSCMAVLRRIFNGQAIVFKEDSYKDLNVPLPAIVQVNKELYVMNIIF